MGYPHTCDDSLSTFAECTKGMCWGKKKRRKRRDIPPTHSHVVAGSVRNTNLKRIVRQAGKLLQHSLDDSKMRQNI